MVYSRTFFNCSFALFQNDNTWEYFLLSNFADYFYAVGEIKIPEAICENCSKSNYM